MSPSRGPAQPAVEWPPGPMRPARTSSDGRASRNDPPGIPLAAEGWLDAVVPSPADRCVLMLAHSLAPPVLDRFDALATALSPRFDVVLGLTGPQRPPPAIGEVEILSPDEIFRPELGAKAATGSVVPGNVDLALLAFARRRPAYGHVWLVEYDVHFEGGAEPLATLDAASDAPLIVADGLRARAEQPGWHWWPSLRTTPLPGLVRPGQRRGLLCIARLGAGLIARLEAAYRAGWQGHSEAVIPTLAWQAGMQSETLNDVAERALGRRILDGDSFRHDRCHFSPGARLYHPVKTAEREELIRRHAIRHWARERLRARRGVRGG